MATATKSKPRPKRPARPSVPSAPEREGEAAEPEHPTVPRIIGEPDPAGDGMMFSVSKGDSVFHLNYEGDEMRQGQEIMGPYEVLRVTPEALIVEMGGQPGLIRWPYVVLPLTVSDSRKDDNLFVPLCNVRRYLRGVVQTALEETPD